MPFVTGSRRTDRRAFRLYRDAIIFTSLCLPLASRTFIVLKLKRLEKIIGVTVVDPIRDERGWAFRDGPGYSTDPINGFHFLSEAYQATDPGFDRRITVPVLWINKVKDR